MNENSKLEQLEPTPLSQYVDPSDFDEFPARTEIPYENELGEPFDLSVTVHSPEALEHLLEHFIRCAYHEEDVETSAEMEQREIEEAEETEAQPPGLDFHFGPPVEKVGFAWELQANTTRENSVWTATWPEEGDGVGRAWVEPSQGIVNGIVFYGGDSTPLQQCPTGVRTDFTLPNRENSTMTFTIQLTPVSVGRSFFAVGGDVNDSGTIP